MKQAKTSEGSRKFWPTNHIVYKFPKTSFVKYCVSKLGTVETTPLKQQSIIFKYKSSDTLFTRFFYKNQSIWGDPSCSQVFVQFEPQLFLNCSCFLMSVIRFGTVTKVLSLVFKTRAA